MIESHVIVDAVVIDPSLAGRETARRFEEIGPCVPVLSVLSFVHGRRGLQKNDRSTHYGDADNHNTGGLEQSPRIIEEGVYLLVGYVLQRFEAGNAIEGLRLDALKSVDHIIAPEDGQGVVSGSSEAVLTKNVDEVPIGRAVVENGSASFAMKRHESGGFSEPACVSKAPKRIRASVGRCAVGHAPKSTAYLEKAASRAAGTVRR